jgi:hypothetical protein
MFSKITTLGYNTAVYVASKASETIQSSVTLFLESGRGIEKYIEDALQRFEPVTVQVRCRQVGPDKEAYNIEFDSADIETAHLAGRLVQPRFKIFVANPDINREVLAARLEKAASEHLQVMHARVAQLHREYEAEQKKQSETHANIAVSTLDQLLTALMIGALPASILFAPLLILAPLLWLMVGLGGLVVIVDILPKLLLGYLHVQFPNIKMLQPEKVAQAQEIEKQAQAYRTVLRQLLRSIELEVDLDLAHTAHSIL